MTSLPPPAPPPPTPTISGGIQPLGLVGLLGCGAAVAGSFMAWISVISGFGSADVRGTEGDGKLTAGLALVAGLLAIVGLSKNSRAKIRGAGALCAIGAIGSGYELQHVSSKISDVGSNEFVHASVGMGIWVMLAGFIVGAACLLKATPPKIVS